MWIYENQLVDFAQWACKILNNGYVMYTQEDVFIVPCKKGELKGSQKGHMKTIT
jgi:hypothetical protein